MLERTLIVANHPRADQLLLPAFLTMAKNRPTNLVADSFWQILSPLIKIIPVDYSKYAPRSKRVTEIQKTIYAICSKLHYFTPQKLHKEEIISAAAEKLIQGENLLIFPSGKSVVDGEAEWRHGVSHILMRVLSEVPSCSVAFLYIANPTSWQLSEPVTCTAPQMAEMEPTALTPIMRHSFDRYVDAHQQPHKESPQRQLFARAIPRTAV